MNTALLDDEEIVYESRAKLQRGLGTVGGRLTLTSKRLIFEPLKSSNQSELVVVKLSHILGMRKRWTMYRRRIPIFPSTLSVKMKTDKVYRFVLLRRSAWAKRIHAQKIAKSMEEAEAKFERTGN